jgi:hypothetical protein
MKIRLNMIKRESMHRISVLCLSIFMAGTAHALSSLKDQEKGFELDVEWISSPKPPITVNSNKTAEPVIWPEEDSASWQIVQNDRTLSTVLARWSQKAGWQLVWDAERDFPIENHIVLEGTFVMVVQTVMDSLSETDYPLQASMNPSTRVIRIARYLEARRK